jgi:methylmalonyl-CoA/ethylmalonyl-CoA epimerase
MFKYLHHVHYAVENLDDVIRYLEKNFDMKPVKVEIGKSTSPANEATYVVGETEIHVTQPTTTDSPLAKHMARHGPGVFHVAWGIEGIEEAFKRAVANGNDMRRKQVDVSPRGYKTVNIEPSSSYGLGFQLIERFKPGETLEQALEQAKQAQKS